MQTRIRETFTVVREYTSDDSIEEIENHALFVSEETGEFLHGGCGGEETVSVVTEIDRGLGWEKINIEKI